MADSTASGRGVHQVLGSSRPSGTRHFVRHLLEMVVAMWVGMMVLGGLDRGILAAAGTSVSSVKSAAPEVVALVMALNMTVGMTLWMRHRHHSWAMCAEMAGAMFVPAIAAIVLFWCAVIHSGSILAVEHLPMLPAMIGVMLLRRTEYSQPVHAHVREAA
jgi:flagellar biosynthetic protein FliP